MATRSTIAMEFPNGTVKQVYCHYDGYLENNGRILDLYYNDNTKVAVLLELGALSILAPEIGQKRPFENPFRYGTDDFKKFNDQFKNTCLFYGRDRGEEDVGPKTFTSFEDYVRNHQYEEFEYIKRLDGNWYVCYRDSKEFVKLADELETVKETL